MYMIFLNHFVFVLRYEQDDAATSSSVVLQTPDLRHLSDRREKTEEELACIAAKIREVFT